MKIETKRLILRPFTLDDLDPFANIMADPEVMRFSLNGPLSKKQVEEYLQQKIFVHYEKFGFGLWAVINKEDQILIGYAGLIQQQIDGDDKTELGYRLAPKHWGKGLATEAAAAVCQFAFNQLNMNELISIIDPLNVKSISVAKRIHMQYWKEAVFHRIPVHIYRLQNKPDEAMPSHFQFRPVKNEEKSLVHSWLSQPYIAKWFYGQGLDNTLKHLDEFLNGSADSQYWLGLHNSHPFAFLITSYVKKPGDELAKWCLSEGKTITLDLSIGDPEYLGKGLGVQVIREFLSSQFGHVNEVLIDPEASNAKAIHVYQKAGFKKVGEFIPSHSPHVHYMMRMDLKGSW